MKRPEWLLTPGFAWKIVGVTIAAVGATYLAGWAGAAIVTGAVMVLDGAEQTRQHYDYRRRMALLEVRLRPAPDLAGVRAPTSPGKHVGQLSEDHYWDGAHWVRKP